MWYAWWRHTGTVDNMLFGTLAGLSSRTWTTRKAHARACHGWGQPAFFTLSAPTVNRWPLRTARRFPQV